MWTAPDYVNAARFCNEHGAHATTIDAASIGLARDPGNAMLHVYRAAAYDEFGRSAEAIADCEAAIALDPRGAPAVLASITLALVRARTGDLPGAFSAARTAVAIDPAAYEAHAVLGTLLAWNGAYPAAWPELECHWISERVAFIKRFPGLKEWNGEDLAGKRLLLVHGQGHGDMLQMLRYVPRLRERGATLLMECAPSTIDLVRDNAPHVDAFYLKNETPRECFDAFARMTSLARLCGEDGSYGHSGVPYLRAEPARAAAWAERLGARDGRLRAGLVWAGNPFHQNDRRRSIPLAALAPLGALANVRWISLQVGPRENDVAPDGLDLTRFGPAIASFADTAALIAQLDVVVSADTAVVHLAGALGIPVLLLLPWRCDWRWAPHATDTPWYPTVRLLHAAGPAWDDAVASAARALADWPSAAS